MMLLDKLMLDIQPQQETLYVSSPTGQKQNVQEPSAITIGIAWLLQGGVLLSAAIIVLGVILLLMEPGTLQTEQAFVFPQTFSQVIAGLLALYPQAIITFGLLLLIATPIVRVIASIVIFAIERDRRYVLITAIVLVILMCSLFLGESSSRHGPAVASNYLNLSLGIALLIFTGSLLAGVLGALVGLGGGIMIVPMLTLLFKLPISFAIGVSIISVIAT